MFTPACIDFIARLFIAEGLILGKSNCWPSYRVFFQSFVTRNLVIARTKKVLFKTQAISVVVYLRNSRISFLINIFGLFKYVAILGLNCGGDD